MNNNFGSSCVLYSLVLKIYSNHIILKNNQENRLRKNNSNTEFPNPKFPKTDSIEGMADSLFLTLSEAEG